VAGNAKWRAMPAATVNSPVILNGVKDLIRAGTSDPPLPDAGWFRIIEKTTENAPLA